jgi:hypothetical protein
LDNVAAMEEAQPIVLFYCESFIILRSNRNAINSEHNTLLVSAKKKRIWDTLHITSTSILRRTIPFLFANANHLLAVPYE